MKRFLLLSIVIMSSICANAQWKIGKMTFKNYILYLGGTMEEPYYDEDRVIYFPYTENSDGTCTEYGLDIFWEPFSRSSAFFQHVEFTGYYMADTFNSKRRNISIRKGPGPKFPVAGKIDSNNTIVYQETDNNWLKVYSQEEFTIKEEQLYNTSIDIERFSPDDLMFLGYIHKDNVKSIDITE